MARKLKITENEKYLSTSKGVMTDKAARAAHVGGEVLAFVW